MAALSCCERREVSAFRGPLRLRNLKRCRQLNTHDRALSLLCQCLTPMDVVVEPPANRPPDVKPLNKTFTSRRPATDIVSPDKCTNSGGSIGHPDRRSKPCFDNLRPRVATLWRCTALGVGRRGKLPRRPIHTHSWPRRAAPRAFSAQPVCQRSARARGTTPCIVEHRDSTAVARCRSTASAYSDFQASNGCRCPRPAGDPV